MWTRRGELIDRSLVAGVCRMLVALGLYPQFEVAFLEQSELFYNAEGTHRAATDEVCTPRCARACPRRIVPGGSPESVFLHEPTRRVAKLTSLRPGVPPPPLLPPPSPDLDCLPFL